MRKISAWWIVVTFVIFGLTSWAINELPNLLVDEITINANTISASSTLTVTATGTMSQTVSGAYNITADGSMAHRVGGNYSEVRVGTTSSDIYGNSLFRLGGNYSSITVGTVSSNIYSHKNENIGGGYNSEIVGSSSVRVAGSDVRAVVGTRSTTISGSDNRSVAGSIVDTIVGNFTRVLTGTMSTNIGSNFNRVVAGTMSTDISGNVNLYGRIATASFNGAVTLRPEGDLSILTGSSGDVIISDQLAVGASTNPRGSAIAEFISGGAKALGLPVLTSAERTALVNPLMGMLAYIRSTSLMAFYDGTSWQDVDLASNVPTVTSWSTFAITVGATVTAPTKATTHTEYAAFRRMGSNLELMYTYNHTSNVGAAAGSGNYLFPIQASGGTNTIDETFLMNVGKASMAGSCGNGALNASGTGNIVRAAVHNSTNLSLRYTNASTDHQIFDSTTISWASATLTVNFTCSVPITGWTCCN